MSITPLVDVVFILLFFFMLASSFNAWNNIDLNMASPDPSNNTADNTLIIQVRSSLNVKLDDNYLTLEELSDYLKQHPSYPHLYPILRPEQSTTIQDMVSVLEFLQSRFNLSVSMDVR